MESASGRRASEKSSRTATEKKGPLEAFLRRGERELKAEIRAAQRLLLEVAEGTRHVSPEQLVAAEVTEASKSSSKGCPVGPTKLASSARLGDGPGNLGLGSLPSGGELQLDVGTLTSHQDVVERHHKACEFRYQLNSFLYLVLCIYYIMYHLYTLVFWSRSQRRSGMSLACALVHGRAPFCFSVTARQLGASPPLISAAFAGSLLGFFEA